MSIFVDSVKKDISNLRKKYGNADFINVTSKGNEPWNKFSPFFAHGKIPIPNSEGYYSKSVEGIWQGLKIFKTEGISTNSFNNSSMKGLKRTILSYGKPLGHQNGIDSNEILSYIDARKKLFLPSYLFILENVLQIEVNALIKMSALKKIVLLDYETNCDVLNPKSPLSHAFLIKSFIEGNYGENIEPTKNDQLSLF